MKKILLIWTFILLSAIGFAQNMKAFISHKAYCTDKMQPYIEFTFIIGGNTVQYTLDEQQKYKADVEIQVDMKKGDSTVRTLHYILSSDAFEDSTRTNKPDFADIQKVPVPQGEYFLYFSLKDCHYSDSATELKYIDRIDANFPTNRISSSRISLYKEIGAPRSPDLYTKYGFYLPPLYYNFVPESQYELPFAVEIYNTVNILGADKPLKAKCFIENVENKLVVSPNYILTKQLKTEGVVLIFDHFNVFQLPSGNYNAVVELYDEYDSLLLVNKIFFQKSNPSVKLDLSHYIDVVIDSSFVSDMNDRTVLEEYIYSLYPIATTIEREFFDKQMKKIPTEQLQRFFYSFWFAREPNNPEMAWKQYNTMVKYVQERFGSKLVKGYRTDRGRVYLQYGQPNEIKEIPSDPVTVPYEIWHYYYLDNQSNVKFVFYDPSMVGNDYELLHSNKYGELNDPNWKMKLVRGIQIQRDIYETEPEEYFGGDIKGNWKYH